jgi:hypothetical protein
MALFTGQINWETVRDEASYLTIVTNLREIMSKAINISYSSRLEFAEGNAKGRNPDQGDLPMRL